MGSIMIGEAPNLIMLIEVVTLLRYVIPNDRSWKNLVETIMVEAALVM